MYKLAVPLVLILVSPLASAIDCQTYTGGYTECTGAGGYKASSQGYTGGYSESWDNRGNSARSYEYTGGQRSIYPGSTGVVPTVPHQGSTSTTSDGGYNPFRR